MKKRYLTKYILTFIFVLISIFFNISFWYESTDLMEQAFRPAESYDLIIDIWKTKNQVWNELLRWWTTITLWESIIKKSCFDQHDNKVYIYQNWIKTYIEDETECVRAGGTRKRDIIDTSYNPPLIVKIAKILLRITMVLAITMVILNAVMYMTQVMSWKDWKSADAIKNFRNIIIWIIVALMSVSVVQLLISVPKSSLTTSDDVTLTAIWCKFSLNWINTSLKLVELKEYVCKNYDLWYPDDPSSRDRDYIQPWSKWPDHMDDRAIWANRCKVFVDVNDSDSWKWIRIKDSVAKSICKNELNWTYWLIFN